LLLALDTATRFISLALHDGSRIQYEATWHTQNNHTVELTPAIHAALTQIGLVPADLKAVAVSQGPGSFTGLRIGLGVAKGLAMALQLDLVAVPTLEIVAAAQPPAEGTLLAVLQAGRGRICMQPFRHGGSGWTAIQAPEITTWEDAVAQIDGLTTFAGPATFAGEIDDSGHAALTNAAAQPVVALGSRNLRRAGDLAEIAWARLRAGQRDDPATVTAIYLHQPGVPHP